MAEMIFEKFRNLLWKIAASATLVQKSVSCVRWSIVAKRDWYNLQQNSSVWLFLYGSNYVAMSTQSIDINVSDIWSFRFA